MSCSFPNITFAELRINHGVLWCIGITVAGVAVPGITVDGLSVAGSVEDNSCMTTLERPLLSLVLTL